MRGQRERPSCLSPALAAPSCPQAWELLGTGCRTRLGAGWWGQTPFGLPPGLGWVRRCSPLQQQGPRLQGWRCPRRGAGLGAMNPRQVSTAQCWAGGFQQRGQQEEGQREIPQLPLILQALQDVVPPAWHHWCPLCLQPPRGLEGPQGPQAGEEAGRGQRWGARGHVGTLLPKVLASLRPFRVRETPAECSQHPPQAVGSLVPRGCSHLGCRRQRGGPRWVLVLSSPPCPQQRQLAKGWRHPGPSGPGERTGRRGPAPPM